MHPPIKVKKGEAFSISFVAVDWVNNAQIFSILSSSGGSFIVKVTKNCTDLTFNVLSTQDSEILNLYTDGPCGNNPISTRH